MGNIAHMKAINASIRVCGQPVKERKQSIYQKPVTTSAESSTIRDEDETPYMNKYKSLVRYINNYMDQISTVPNGISKRTKPKRSKAARLEDDELWASKNVFVVQEDGPNKGKYIPQRDKRGHIIVDPTFYIKSNPIQIDYNEFKKFTKNNDLA